MSDELYQGADRGTFRVMRLTDDTGVQLRVNARIANAAAFVYLTDLHYAIVGYEIEWWGEYDKAPYAGGTSKPYLPKGRTQSNRMYFRMKSSNLRKMLYLEDAIINDFLAHKVLGDPMKLQSFNQEARDQIESSNIWRQAEGTEFMYANAVHITRYRATESTPLTVYEQGLAFNLKEGEAGEVSRPTLPGYAFVRERDCLTRIKEIAIGENQSND